MRKFKCIKSYNSGIFLTKGNIYYEKDGTLEYDDGWVDNTFKYNDSACFVGGTLLKDCLEEVKEEDKKVNKFKVGDVVVGNNSHRYGYTNKGVKCEIIRILRDEKIEVRIIDNSYKGDILFVVEPEYFDLANPLTSKSLTISTSDTTTILTDGIITVSVNRYYTDKHDEEIAVSEVIDKYYGELARIEREKNTPKVGDKVKVVDSERTFSYYDTWLIENKVDVKYAIKWTKGVTPKDGKHYTIVAIHEHLTNDDILALIEDEKGCYIINVEGLEVIK